MIATGPLAQLPVALLESEASHGAIRAYAVLALLPRQAGNLIWASQNYVAKQLTCSTRQVRNYLKELFDLEFLEKTTELHQGSRVYKLLGCSLEKGGNEVPAIKLNLNSNSISNSNCRKPDSNRLLASYAEEWQKAFSCFDGKEGRPTLKQKVEEAVKRFRYGNLLSYVKYYLSQGAKWLLQSLAKLHGVITDQVVESLAELTQARKAADAKRKAWNNRFINQEPIPKPSEEERLYFLESLRKLRIGS